MSGTTYWHGDSEGLRRITPEDAAAEAGAEPADDGFLWIDTADPEPAELHRLAETVRLHPSALRDAATVNRRSRYDSYGGIRTIVLKTLWSRHGDDGLGHGTVTIVVSSTVLLTVRHGDHDPLPDTREFLDAHPRLLSHGAAAAGFAVLDRMLSRYRELCDDVDERVTEVERRVFSGGRVDAVGDIYAVQRRVVELREAVTPLLALAEDLLEDDDARPGRATGFLRGVGHHIRRVDASVTSSEMVLDNILNAHLGQISMWQNEDMRRISAWGAIITVPTLIAGVYGMNFRHMPELRWWIGYPLILAVMAVVCLLLYRGFRRNGWL
ncbi:magnesium transporter [Stackebrandtia albiflava]|uniref:Magnesium transporter n=1 Tax=Stackebrandtia albiflava TaxID=406432 RepID=A0A562VCP8_9ACTN|nr:magnesium and cobalt transport protein CorA [Stackebrandtia albiflava]TWJ15656.1 magnesium transporter [Stackebrandtia albiflava]